LKSIISTILMLMIWQLATSQEDKISVAIAGFDNRTGVFKNESTIETIPELLKTELALLGDLIVVERSKLEAALSEQALSQTGVIDTSKVKTVGQLTNAQFVITGELNSVGNRLRIDAHITRVETGEIFAEKVTGPNENSLENMVRFLARNINYNLTGNGEHRDEKTIFEFHPKVVLGSGLATAAFAVYFQNDYENKYDKYKASVNLDDIADYYDKANGSLKARNAALGISLALFTVGTVFWFVDKNNSNKILSSNSTNAFAIAPYYNYQSNAFGFQLVLIK
jgi:TolB-like protein